ncbi:Flp family type IVb pilin [Streptomyces vilmorinianum]|uniref:Flp family type IVb pilin n=1 Tax=Streptomyces vilmorinianum TaxID=3051092 RepID=UPI0010FAE8BC|nr:Flp family type IVb pilin [Streptomyces vilmorinianum]
MSDVLLKAVTRTKVHFGGWVRARSRDRGQTAVEYLGIIVVVVAIVVAITGTSIGQDIMNAIRTKISSLTGGGGGE